MSNFLNDYASLLTEPLRHRETALRTELIDSFENLRDCTKVIGRLLWEYKQLFKQNRIWNRFITGIARLLRYNSRTLYRWVEAHEEKLELRPRRKDLNKEASNEQQTALTNDQAEFLLGRLRIRKAVAGFPERQRLDILRQMIASEAFDTWGIQEAFTLHIVPTRPVLQLNQVLET